MNSKKVILLTIISSVLLSGCKDASVSTEENTKQSVSQEHEVYEACAFDNLYTFTDVTGVACHEVIEGVSETSYVYHIEGKSDQLINQYVMYLTSDFGMDISNESGDLLYQKEEGSILTSLSNENGFVVYTISIPVADGILETRLEEIYNTALGMITDGKYRDAYEVLRSDEEIREYKDSEALRYYCKGMIVREYKTYGTAIEYFEKAEGVLDADKMLEELRSIVRKYDGTYYAADLKYPDMNIGSYLFVHDGKAELEHESVYNEGDSVYYTYELMDKEIVGKSGYMLMLGRNNGDLEKPDEDSYDYSFEVMDNGEIMVIAYESNEYRTFNGLFIKKSDSFPDEK